MAIKVKSVERAAEKFLSRASVAGPDYSFGIKDTGDWDVKAKAGKEAFEAGMADAIARDARTKGIEKAGNAKWQSKAIALGVKRFPEGVRAAKADYIREVGPYLEVIRGLELPPRGPKGSPENFERSRVVGEALRNKKLAG